MAESIALKVCSFLWRIASTARPDLDSASDCFVRSSVILSRTSSGTTLPLAFSWSLMSAGSVATTCFVLLSRTRVSTSRTSSLLSGGASASGESNLDSLSSESAPVTGAVSGAGEVASWWDGFLRERLPRRICQLDAACSGGLVDFLLGCPNGFWGNNLGSRGGTLCGERAGSERNSDGRNTP